MSARMARLFGIVCGGALQVALHAGGQPPAGAAAPSPELRVDVRVVDDSGAPVRDLAATDFQLSVDGTPRPVTTATFVGYGASPAGPTSEDDDPEAGYASNAAASRPRSVVLVADEGQSRPQATALLVEAAAAVIDALKPGDVAALVRLPRLTQGTDFTADHDRLRSDVRQLTGRATPFASPGTGITLGAAEEYQRGVGMARERLTERLCGPASRSGSSTAGPGGGLSGDRCSASLAAEAKTLVDDAVLRTRDTTYGLERVMERLMPLPGPKLVVLLSEGMYVADDGRVLGRTATLAARARATIVALRPEVGRDSIASPALIANDSTAPLLSRGLERLTNATGGSLFEAGAKGSAAVVERMLRETSGYYTIAFATTTADREPRSHAVAIATTRAGLVVYAHRELPADAVRQGQPAEERLRALLASPLQAGDLPIRAAMFTSPVASGKVRTFVQSIVGVDQAQAKDASGAVAVIDPKGEVVTSFGLEPAVLNDSDPRNGRVLGGARDVDPGEYRLRVAVVLPDGRAGSVDAPLVARPRQAGDVSYSDLMVGLRPAAGQAFRPLPDPVVDRELVMAVELFSTDPETTAGTEVRFDIADQPASEPLVEHVAEVPQGRRAATAAAALELTLRPGTYVARAQITAPGAEPVHLTRRFTVVAGSGAAGVLPARVDEAGVPAPALLPFRRAHAVDRDVIGPFLDHAATLSPPGRAGAALLAKAREGTFTVPATAPARADALAHSLVRGLAALRDGTPSACVAAFNEAIERADGFIGFALFQGDCYAASGHDRDAVAAWQMALLGNVGMPVIYEHLVDGLLRLGEGEKALAALAEGDLVWTDRRGFDMRRGLALALLDRHQEALPLLEAAAADPSADANLLFVAMRSMHAGRRAGWLEASDTVRQRFDDYLQRYANAKGAQIDVARDWRKPFAK